MPGAPAPPPSRDETCPSCTEPSVALFPCDPDDDDYVTGDIVIMHESVHTPIDLIFAASTQSKSGLAPAPVPSTASRSTNSRKLKQRPAIVCNDDSLDRDEASLDVNTTMACLMASLEGLSTYDDLPDILKDHFALPVSPHCEIREGVPHLHTSPEWLKKHIWLIASPYKSSGNVLGRWQWEDQDGTRDDHQSFRVHDKEFIKLKAVCEERMRKWMKLCVTDEMYIAACKQQYDIFRKPQEWQKHLMTQSWVEQANDSNDSGYTTGLNEQQAHMSPESNKENAQTTSSSSTKTAPEETSKSEQLPGDIVKPMAERIRGVFRRRGKGRGKAPRTSPAGQSDSKRDTVDEAREGNGRAAKKAKWRRGFGRSRGSHV